jgi:hypothetical protein
MHFSVVSCFEFKGRSPGNAGEDGKSAGGLPPGFDPASAGITPQKGYAPIKD